MSARRLAVGCAALVSLVCASRAGRAAQALDFRQWGDFSFRAAAVRLTADHVLTLDGDAALRYREVTLTGDHITVFLDLKALDAAGHLDLFDGSHHIRAAQGHFNLETREGAFDEVTADLHPADTTGVLHVRARRIEMHGDTVTVTEAHLTTCSLPEPHYDIQVASGVFVQEQTLRLRGARITLLGIRAPVPSNLTFDLRPRSLPIEGLTIPGFSNLDGFFVESHLSFPTPADQTRQGILRLTTQRSVRGHLENIWHRPWGDLSLLAGVREDLTDRTIATHELEPTLTRRTIDRAPEVRAEPRPSRFGSLILTTSVTAGHYRERGLAEDERLSSTAQLEHTPIALGGFSLIPLVAARGSVYGDGDSMLQTVPGVVLKLPQIGPLALQLAYFGRHQTGTSPFQFDQIQIAKELMAQGRLDIARAYAVEFVVRYDTETEVVPDYQVSVLRTLDCLEYGLRYRHFRQEFSLVVRLIGF